MNWKQYGAGIVAGAIVAMIAGYIIFDTLTSGFYDANMGSATDVMRESQLLWARALGTVAYAALIAYTLDARSRALTPMTGLWTGAIVGFLIWATVDFIYLGILNVTTLTLAIVDPLLEAVRGGITGAAVAAVAARV